MAKKKIAKRSTIWKLSLNKDDKNPSGLTRLLIILLVLIPKGTYRPDYAMTNGRNGEYSGCWADFRLCYINPLSWLFVGLSFIACLLAGVWIFITQYIPEFFGKQSIYIKNHDLSKILDKKEEADS